MLSYGVIGTGAIGGYYGGMLARGGKDVHFLLHHDYEYVKANGLQIDSVNGNFHLDGINVYADSAEMPKCDVVLVCLKTVNNFRLAEMLPHLLHEHTLVILIQNGIGLEADLHETFPNQPIAAGLAFICSGKVGLGHISHQDYGKLTIAPFCAGADEVIADVIRDFTEVGVEAVTACYAESRWKKAVWNIPFNGMTVALDTTTNLLLVNNDTEHLIRELMLEVIHAGNAAGVEHPIPDSFADVMIASTKVMTPYSPSMKLDYDNRRPMEIYYLYSRPILEAHKVNVDMPKVSMLENMLKFIQKEKY